jgi:hypothetical protein
VCYAVVTKPTGCPGGCQWPVCGSKCANRPEHQDECRYVRQLRPKTKSDGQTWSVGIYNAITAVRGLSIKHGEYEYFLDVLQKKLTKKLTFEVFFNDSAESFNYNLLNFQNLTADRSSPIYFYF